MRWKIALSFVLVYSTIAPADLKEKIQNLNETVKKVGNIPSECSTCTYYGAGQGVNPLDLMKSCIESLCPDSGFSLSALYGKMMLRAARPDTEYDKEIAPLVDAITKENAIGKTTSGSKTLEWIKNAKELKDPGGIRIFNFMMSLKIFSKMKFKYDKDNLIVDAKNSRATLENLSDEEFSKQVNISNIIIKLYSQKAIEETDPSRVQLYYPGIKFKEKVTEVISSIQEKGKKIANDPELQFLLKIETFKDLISGEKLKEKFESSEQINPALIQELNSADAGANVFLSLATDPELKRLLESPPIDIKKAAAELGVEKVLRDRVLGNKFILDGGRAVPLKCKTAFAMGQEGLPSQKEVESFKKKVSAIKEKFLSKAKFLMCSEATQKFETEVNKWEASLPLSREQHLANMKNSLAQELVKVKEEQAQDEQVRNSPHRDVIMSLSVVSIKEDYSAWTVESDEICESQMPNILPDATASFSNRFVVGPIVVRNRNAEGISHHELGHKLFHFMKGQNSCGDNAPFADIRTCLLGNHSELTAGEVLVENSKIAMDIKSKYESEDWADLVSSMVEDKKSNLACLFARKVSPEDYASLSLRNQDSTDPHSSDLFRLLHLNFLKTGNVPVLCEQALAARGEKANFKNCLKP